MSGTAYRGVVVIAFAATATGLAAQSPPSAPAAAVAAKPDSFARVQIMDEVFPEGTSAIRPRVTLERGMVYRVEIQPAVATVNIRSARHPSLPPLFLTPLEGGGPPGRARRSSTSSCHAAPRNTKSRSPTTAWSRYASGSRPIPGRCRAGADAAGLEGPARRRFQPARRVPRRLHGSGQLQSGSGHGQRHRRRGLLRRRPTRPVVQRAAGGCVLDIARLWRSGSAGQIWYLGTEPGWVVAASGAGRAIGRGLGGDCDLRGEHGLHARGLGRQGLRAAARRHLWVGAQAGFASMHVITYGYGGETHLVPRIAADLQARF